MATRDRVDAMIQRVAAAHRALLGDLRDRTLDPSAPSALPGWTIGHLMTHIARNADSVVRRLEASARGEHIDQYVGGQEARAKEIDSGAGRTFGALRDDVTVTCALLESTAASLPPHAWGFHTTSVSGQSQDALTVLIRRQREVVLHHTDLGIGFEPASWPLDLVDELMAEMLPALATRTDPASLVGWMTGRCGAPELSGWL